MVGSGERASASDGLRLIKAFHHISDGTRRLEIIELAERYAEESIKEANDSEPARRPA